MDRIKEIFEKAPVTLLLAAFLAYLGYEYYNFTTDAGSPLNQKYAEIEETKKKNQALQESIAKTNEFIKKLDGKKAELRGLAQELKDLKATLSDNFDLPEFMKMVI